MFRNMIVYPLAAMAAFSHAADFHLVREGVPRTHIVLPADADGRLLECLGALPIGEVVAGDAKVAVSL